LLSIGFLLSSLSVVQRALLSKQLAFRTLAIAETVAAVVSSAVAIVCAEEGLGVFSLVVQVNLMAGITTVVLWQTSGWRPTFAFSIDDVRSIWGFSANVVGFNIVNYFGRNLDYILIGRFLGAQPLGYYTLAYNLLLFPVQNLTYTVGRVTFPVYASMQDDNDRLGRAYLRVVGTLAMLSFPLMLGLLAVCDVFVRTVYGPRWAPAIPAVAIFAPVGLVQSISSMNGSVYQAKGRADLQFRIGMLFSLLVVASFFVGLHWGMLGVAGAYAIVAVVILGYPLFAIPLGLIGLRFPDLLRAIRQPLVASLVMLGGLGVLRLAFPELATGGAGGLLVLVGAGAAIFFGAAFVLSRAQLREMWFLIRPAT
jgi:PST family polysaccharide transporter